MDDKYKVLFLSSMIILSFSYIYDLPATLNDHMNFDNKARNLAFLYSVYALPNILIPLFFGWTASLDWISECLCFLVFLGQVLYSIGVYKMHYRLMVVGRFVYGLGGESFSVLINRLISKEFKGKDLAFTLGLFSSITRMGAILNFLTSPILAEKLHRTVPCILGIILTLASFMSCLVLNQVLRRQRTSYTLVDKKKEVEEDILQTTECPPIEKVDYSQIFYKVDFNQSPYTPWEKMDYTSEISEHLEDSEIIENTIFYEPPLKKAKTLHSTFFLLATISFLIALVWAPLYSLAPILFRVRYNFNSVESGHLLSIIEILGLFLTPIVGTLADKYGKKIYFILSGCILLFLAHLCLALNQMSPFFVVTVLGLAGPLVNCYWPCIPHLVSENNLTNGFAIIFCLLNLAFTLSPILMGSLMSRTNSFRYVEMFIVGITLSVISVTTLLIYLNRRFGLGLNLKSEK